VTDGNLAGAGVRASQGWIVVNDHQLAIAETVQVPALPGGPRLSMDFNETLGGVFPGLRRGNPVNH